MLSHEIARTRFQLLVFPALDDLSLHHTGAGMPTRANPDEDCVGGRYVQNSCHSIFLVELQYTEEK